MGKIDRMRAHEVGQVADQAWKLAQFSSDEDGIDMMVWHAARALDAVADLRKFGLPQAKLQHCRYLRENMESLRKLLNQEEAAVKAEILEERARLLREKAG